MTPHTKRKLIHYWRRHIRPIGILVLVFTSFRSIVSDWNDVPTGSMRPTIIDGDRIYVNKLAYGLKVPFTTWHITRWGSPARGEIVVFYKPTDGVRLVKRVIGVPGDKIKLDGNMLTINGKRLEYEEIGNDVGDPLPAPPRRYFREHLGDYVHTIAIYSDVRTVARPDFRDLQEFTVPAGMYYMMGDNRDNSADSRDFGFVPEGEILGRSTRTVFSLDKGNYWLPRKDRWMKALP